MDYEKVKNKFGNWGELFKLFIESDKFDLIFSFLKSETKKNKVIIPKSEDVFKSFEITDRHQIKTIIFMMDPYATVKDNIFLADGIPMSCKNTGRLQPSLEFFYQAIEQQYKGFDPDMCYRPDCSYLLREEGVLLINSALTCEMQKPGSHQMVWELFMAYFIEQVLNKFFSGLPIVLCGQSAQRLEKYINPLVHHIHKTTHPASIAHSGGTEWKTEMFSFIDKIVEANNGPSERIRWYRIKGDDGYDKMPEFVKKDFSNKGTKSGKELGLPFD